jgi:hypothetical protein
MAPTWYGSTRPNDPGDSEEVSRTLITNARIASRGLVPTLGAFHRATVLLAL